MPPQIALVAFIGFIAWLWYRDTRNRPQVSGATWIALLWVVICASRPVSEWFTSGQTSSADAYSEGSPMDRAAWLALIVAGLLVLARRGMSWKAVIRENRGLFAFYGYCLLSVLWSDEPFVAFKRLFKDFGSVIMVLVILTEAAPLEGIKAVFIRAACILVPLSVLFTRFIPELGRMYTGYSENELMYVGVATHKNTLGALLIVSTVFLVWDLAGRWAARKTTGHRVDTMAIGVVLLMALWLVRIANSATAVACTLVGIAVLMLSRTGAFRKRVSKIEVYGAVAVVTWLILDKGLHVNEFFVVNVLGRDMTLTTRTEAWDIFMNVDLNPLIGAGFKSFWMGDRMVEMWAAVGGQIIQAHNGYIEMYLEGGILGVVFLVSMLWLAFGKIKRGLLVNDERAGLRLAFWVLALLYNFSEASFTYVGILWFVTLLVVIDGPPGTAPAQAVATPNTRAVAAPAAVHKWKPKPQIVRTSS